MDRGTDALLKAEHAEISQGDVFWVAPDETRGSVPGQSHPHVVVQEDVFNRSRISTVIVCALTSNRGRATEPGNVLLDPGEGDLEKQSVIVVSQVSCLYKSRLGARIGSLSKRRVEQVLAGMRLQQASFFRQGAARPSDPEPTTAFDFPADSSGS